MSDLTSALLAALGTSGLVGFGTLVVRAFLQALKATAEINAEKNRTIDRLQGLIDHKNGTIDRLDTVVDRLRMDLIEANRVSARKDIELERLQAELERQTGTGP